MVVACIGLGANLGDAPATVRAAIQALGRLPQTRLLAASGLYRTPAWGNEAQPDFINAAAAVETALAAPALLEHLLATEQSFGRVREPGQHWGPRTLDLDLLLYGEQTIALPQLKVPHPFLHERAFALLPLADVAPEAVIPGHGTVHDVLAAMKTCDIEPIGG
ncbi:2-amino-4-hydroxy-6-hydroxymethyldihydropteridine pyrophosphokinase [Stenotrophomonas humi]|uniref:2-amino-4-hydroxy-6-hydroxymethyldihydropteridine pyrophosphokinase n=1 Tax=Stenotrophomonas humi TaxID=405444 RepID=A0A0R0C6L1_9GAMM|nr:2-amino-4-hydroxy-6-hydroxymethyldihydropteridine diphosphokinase [Stenotrophomonas humi]KRG65109.1 2-amino-4-hydroxy-6-hydroxymethyldihydropteridine pyrophosphokinase [Stenotrophomonas humi]